MALKFDCMVWLISENWLMATLSWACWAEGWPQKCWKGRWSHHLLRCWRMFHCPKRIGNVYILFKHWPKIFKCGPINIVSVMFTKFIMKNTYIVKLSNAYTLRRRSLLQDFCRGQRFGHFQLAWRSFQLAHWVISGSYVLSILEISIVDDHKYEIIHQQFHGLWSFQTHDFQFLALDYIDL